MTDFVARRREFSNWPEIDRVRFIGQLIDAIADTELRGVSASVHMDAVKEANERFGFSYTPYSVALALAMESFRDYFGPYQSSECFLDRIERGGAELILANQILARDGKYNDWWQERNVSWRHLTKDEMTLTLRGKEAADFAAWECMAHAETALGLSGKGRGSHWSRSRKSAIELAKAAPINGRLHSYPEITFLFERIRDYA
jgi:hypothetical protein